MDKKKIILTTICMAGVMVLALLLVLLANGATFGTNKKSSSSKVASTDNGESRVAEDGRVLGTSLQAFMNDDDFFDKDEPEQKEVDVLPENLETTETQMEFVESEELLDIDFLIHTADEINELEEDALAKDRAEGIIDADETENSDFMTGNAVVLGIDVSGWNGDIDWEKVKEAGVKFAIIRCGYRGYSSGWLVEDSYFQKNLKGATEAGINVGVYFFSQAIDDAEAIEEAKTAISLIGDTKIDYPIFIDTEASGGDGRADSLDNTTRTKVCQAFCKTIVDYGYQAGIYASCNWFNNKLSFSAIDQYVIWLAEYRSTPQFDEYYDLWQYTSKGNVDGIDGKVDLSVSYLGY